jgi:hypothetical protein
VNWCKPHWDKLRQAIQDRGLDKFGAKDGNEVITEIVSQIEGNEETFDPLLGSWSRINVAMVKSLQRLGRGQEALQLRCPCCILVEDGQPQTVDNWINGVTDEAKLYAIDQGLMKGDG